MAMAQPKKIEKPVPGPDTQAFWDAAAKGKLLIKKCGECGKSHYYPRANCPYCLSAKTEWVESKGTGTIYTYSVMRRSPVPYAICYVRLDDGVTMMSNLVDMDLDKIKIGAKVKVVFKPSDGGPPVPMFAPV
jgi:uncharacterized protein